MSFVKRWTRSDSCYRLPSLERDLLYRLHEWGHPANSKVIGQGAVQIYLVKSGMVLGNQSEDHGTWRQTCIYIVRPFHHVS